MKDNSRFWYRCFALALALAAAGSATAAAAQPPRAADRQLDRAVEGLVDRAGGPASAVAVIQRGDRRRTFRAGTADLASGAAPKGGDRMRIASTAKALSGAAALSLVDAGALRLDDTIGEWLPAQPAAWHPITLVQLLQHTSGLADFTQSAAFQHDVSAAPDDPPPPAALLDYVAGDPLRFPPGSEYHYSNTDNILVGLIVEAATGKAYHRELRRRVFDPLGMGRSALRPNRELGEPFIHGYSRGDGDYEDVSELVDFGGWAWASGGVVSTPANMNRFVRGYVGGTLFGGDARAAQRDFLPGATSEPPGPGKNSAGLALFRYDTSCGTVFGHTGNVLGYTQLIAANRSGRRSLSFTISTQIDDGLLPALRRAERRAVCAALARR